MMNNSFVKKLSSFRKNDDEKESRILDYIYDVVFDLLGDEKYDHVDDILKELTEEQEPVLFVFLITTLTAVNCNRQNLKNWRMFADYCIKVAKDLNKEDCLRGLVEDETEPDDFTKTFHKQFVLRK